MHKLDILMTHYMEPSAIVRRFLDSLSKQTYKDFKVTIVDDGLECPNVDISGYNFEIEHLKFPHHTVSKARNNALDNTVGEYVMFCDCDDMFDDRNASGLGRAMWRISANCIDVYRTSYWSEAWKKCLGKQLSSLYSDEAEDEIVLVNSMNISTVHSKIYKRSFLEKYGLRFLDDLWMNEDGVLNHLAWDICSLVHGRTMNDCEMFYIWKHNSHSVTRTNTLYPIKGYDQFIKVSAHILRKMLEVDKNTDMGLTVAESVFQGYYWLYLYSDRFIGIPGFEEFLESDMIELRKYLVEFWKYVDEDTLGRDDFKSYEKRFMDKLDKCDMSEKDDFRTWVGKLT